MIAHHERVRELHLERAPQRAGQLRQAVGDLERLLPLQVLLEVLRARLDLAVAEQVVQEAVHRRASQQRRIQLDRDVHVHLGQQEPRDPLDLVRRAAVEGRERDLVRQTRREVEVAQVREIRGDLAAQPLDLGARVLHALDPGADLGRTDAGQVVADAHVVERVRLAGVAGDARCAEHVHEHGARHVLAQAFGEAQLLAPLDVVADVGGVDARPRDRQPVVDLDRLELEDAAPGQPRQHHVLGHLVLRAGRGAERVRRAMAVEEDGGVEVRGAAPELARGQVEDLRLALVLAKHPAHERREGRGDQLSHGAPSWSHTAPTALPRPPGRGNGRSAPRGPPRSAR